MKIYYMRDNHTFRELPEGKEFETVMEEFDSGWTYGMLCCSERNNNKVPYVHGRGAETRETFCKEAKDYISKIKELYAKDSNNCGDTNTD